MSRPFGEATLLSLPVVGRGVPPSRPPNRHRNSADLCYTIHTQETTRDAAENQIVVYQPNETVRLDVRLENETVWLTQAQLCDLFGVVKSNVSYHLKNIFGTNELDYGATVQKIRTVRTEAGRTVSRDIEYFNLDVIISLGYRINSRLGIQFRQWATRVLKEYLLHGQVVNQRLALLEDKVDRRLAKHDDRIATLEQKVDFFVQTKEPPLQSIFYQNKFWDAKSLLIKFIRRAKKELVVIDAYPGVANGECCQCVNVASGHFQFPIKEAA